MTRLASTPIVLSMDMLDFAAAVMIGNCLTLCVVYGFQEFRKHDYKAPWIAYAAFVMPILAAMISVYLNSQ